VGVAATPILQKSSSAVKPSFNSQLAMPRSNTSVALEKLGFLLNSGTIEQLKQALTEFEQVGLQVEKLINYPIQRFNGRTAVHLAASNGLYDCLELLLNSGGELDVGGGC
jgi:ankyrin repeat protein